MLKPIMNCLPDSFQARSMRSQPSVVMAIGFSQKMCLPAWKAAQTYSSWVKSGLAMATASMSSRESSFR